MIQYPSAVAGLFLSNSLQAGQSEAEGIEDLRDIALLMALAKASRCAGNSTYL